MWRVWIVTIAVSTTAAGGLYLSYTPAASLQARLVVALSGAGTAFLAHRLLAPKARSNAFGSAAFATEDDAADLSQDSGKEVVAGSVLLGKQGSDFISLPPGQARQHGIIVGGSGSGKSYSFFLPNAARLKGTSCVFSDPKSELFRFTSGFHTSLRYAPCEPDASECFNWIPMCRSPRLAEIAARAIVESGKTAHTETIWLDLEAAFLSALFSHASTLSVPTPLTAYRLFTQQNQKTLLAQFAKSSSPLAREQANMFAQTSDRMRGSIVPAVAARLQFMRDPEIARFTSASVLAPRFSRLRQRPTALYWCLHEKDIPRLRPLTSLFFTLLLEELNGDGVQGKNAVPVLLFLDEFGVIGAVPDFETTIALARGRGMGLWLGVQSLSQLESLYGKSAAQTILTNCATKIALGGLDVETAEYFSRTLGQATIARKMRSWQRKRFALLASTTGDALQEHGRLLLTADEVRRLPDDEMLIVTGNRLAMLLKKFRYNAPPHATKTRRLGAVQTLNFPSDASALPSAKPLPPLPDDL